MLDGTAGAGEMAPPTSTWVSARMKRVQGHVSPVNILDGLYTSNSKSLCALFLSAAAWNGAGTMFSLPDTQHDLAHQQAQPRQTRSLVMHPRVNSLVLLNKFQSIRDRRSVTHKGSVNSTFMVVTLHRRSL